MKLMINKLLEFIKDKQKLPIYMVADYEKIITDSEHKSLFGSCYTWLKNIWTNYTEANKLFITSHYLTKQHNWTNWR